MNKASVNFLKVSVFIIGLITLILSIFTLPELAKYAATSAPEYAHLQYPILIGIYITVIPFFYALYQSLKLLNYIQNNDAFSYFAVNSLKNIKYCAGVIITLYVFGMFFLLFQNALHPGIALIGFVIVFASFIVLFFSTVLQELFKNALEIKEENDLTV